MQVFTKNLTDPLTIQTADGVFRYNVKAQGGTVGITGNGTFQGMTSDEITLQDGDSHFMAAEAGCPIKGITIRPITGVAVFEAFFG